MTINEKRGNVFLSYALTSLIVRMPKSALKNKENILIFFRSRLLFFTHRYLMITNHAGSMSWSL